MSEVDALFARLQLRPDATEQDVRRAYARELKKIDQEAQPEAFQELRQAYEQLTWWLRSRAAADAAASEAPAEPPPEVPRDEAPTQPMAYEGETGAGAPAEEAPPMPPAMAAGHAVLDLVVQRLKALSFRDRDDVQAFLLRCMDDERLGSVDARQYFEWGIASILAGGWQPGHELVFAPAVQVFGWGEDRSRLLWLGRPGEIVDQAIGEVAAFDTQDDADRSLQRTVIQALRLPARPGTGDLLKWLPVAEALVAAFPAWLHVVCNSRQIETWREWNAEIPGWRRKIATRKRLRLTRVAHVAREPAASAGSRWWGWAWAVFVLISVARVATHESSPPPRMATPPSLALPPSVALPAPPATQVPLLTPEQQKMRAWIENVNKQSLADAVRPPVDDSEARTRLASLAKGKHSPERCESIATLLHEHAEAHARGDFGAPLDTLVVDCANAREGNLGAGAVQSSARRIIHKSQVELEKLAPQLNRKVLETRPPPVLQGVPAARVQPPPPAPVSAFDLAPNGTAPVTTERNGLGLKPPAN